MRSDWSVKQFSVAWLKMLPLQRMVGYAFIGFLLAVVGCDSASTNQSSNVVDQILGDRELEPISVGVLFSQTGSMSISEMPLKHAVLQAIDEINADGGVLGRRLVPVIRDGRSREDIFAKRAREFAQLGIPVIFGGWRSSDRKAMIPIVESSGILLFYPLQYEGNESSRSVFYGGMVPNQQILPALEWFMGPEGGSRKKIFLIGSDYLFPRTANYIIKKFLEGKSAEVVGELYVPFDHNDFGKEYETIRTAKPDLILSSINGSSNVALFRQFTQNGFDPQSSPIFATSLGESGLRSILPQYTKGHYASWSFFQSLESERSRAFVSRYQAKYGLDRPVHDPMESAYTQVYLWREAVERAGSVSAEEVRKVLEKSIEIEGPAGMVRVDPRNHHL